MYVSVVNLRISALITEFQTNAPMEAGIMILNVIIIHLLQSGKMKMDIKRYRIAELYAMKPGSK